MGPGNRGKSPGKYPAHITDAGRHAREGGHPWQQKTLVQHGAGMGSRLRGNDAAVRGRRRMYNRVEQLPGLLPLLRSPPARGRRCGLNFRRSGQFTNSLTRAFAGMTAAHVAAAGVILWRISITSCYAFRQLFPVLRCPFQFYSVWHRFFNGQLSAHRGVPAAGMPGHIALYTMLWRCPDG